MLLSAAMLALAACASTPHDKVVLDNVARDYVRLVLEIDAHESGYVDAYFGPPEWREEARRNPRDQVALKKEADRIRGLLARFQSEDQIQVQRARVLSANVTSARFRLDMIGGEKVDFADEAERLFALRPHLNPLSSYDSALVRIEQLAPGPGPLAERVDAFRAKYAIPSEKLAAVMDAAIAECRKRTLQHISLPPGESFRMEMVKDKSWGAYNYYLGRNQSLIQINTDLPVVAGNALVLGCHEGYPGHHLQGIYNERSFRSKGWAEFSVAPLYAPASPLNEGGADFGVELAFPGAERVAFERDVLYPLAGLDPATAEPYDQFRKAMTELEGAALTISQMYLDGEIDKRRAIELTQRYELVARDVAEESLEFDEEYRSYVINYSVGEDLVRAYVDRAGSEPRARWAAYEHILSTPTLPSDLMGAKPSAEAAR
ncbi:MAG TPA: hypothetical protein VIA80_06695 [Hyphomonadaceae bacterium]|jgi:hypothetical protein